ncbi:MAG: sugar ABC transporter permease, partial [Devosia sp.]
MATTVQPANDGPIGMAAGHISGSRQAFGRAVVAFATLGFGLVVLLQILNATNVVPRGWENWRPT